MLPSLFRRKVHRLAGLLLVLSTPRAFRQTSPLTCLRTPTLKASSPMSSDSATPQGYTYRWPRPSVTVDTLIFTVEASKVWILLIQRKNDPFQGAWALPGGFVDQNEALDRAAARELEEETGLTDIPMAQIGAFGDPGRDPRGHTITVAYMAFTPSKDCGVKAGDDAADARWFEFGALPPLAFDHRKIVEAAWKRLLIVPSPDPGGSHVGIEKGSGTMLTTFKDDEEAGAVATSKPFKG